MKKGFTTPFSNFFPRRFFCLFALFNGLKRVECSTRFFRVPLSGGAGSALFRKEAPQARIPGRVVFPPGLAVRPVRLSGGHRAHHAGCRARQFRIFAIPDMGHWFAERHWAPPFLFYTIRIITFFRSCFNDMMQRPQQSRIRYGSAWLNALKPIAHGMRVAAEGCPIPARVHTGDRRVWPKAHSCATMSKTTGTEATGYGAFKTADPAGRAGERRRRTQGGQLSQPPNGCDAAE